MNPEYQTVAQMYERLSATVRRRNDTGLKRAIAERTLEPQNPFEPEGRRKPKAAIAIGFAAAAATAGIFLYFSIFR